MKTERTRNQKGQIFLKRGKTCKSWFGRWRRDEIEVLADGSRVIVRRQHCEKLCNYSDRYRSKGDVQPLLDEKLKPLNEGRSSAEGTLSIAKYAEDFFLPYAARELKASTSHGYRWMFKMYIQPRLKVSLRDLRTVDVANLLRDLQRDHDLSRKTLSHVRGLVSSIYVHAVNAGACDGANPARLAAIPKAARSSAGTHAYSPQEIATMLHLLTDTARTAVALMFFCGLRPGEARAVKWTDYDGKSLRITKSMWRTVLGTPKTSGSVGVVPVCDALREILEPLRQPEGFILAGLSGRPIDLHNVAARVCVPILSACATCGKPEHQANGHAYSPVMQWKGWYACRRGLATAAASVDTAMGAKTLLRHKNMATTMGFYIKSEDASGLRASEKISALFDNSAQVVQ